jgi:gamma-glutamylcyclotransferase (GGCT)/AIG2-like uncharacterized protein YtfP
MTSSATRVHVERFDILGPEGLSSSTTSPLFAYGTLQLDDVLQTLIGRVPASTPAQLTNWRAVRLPGRPYPGLVHSSGHTVSGLVFDDLTPDEWLLLDRFEDTDYDLQQIPLDAGGAAWAYVWQKEAEDADWLLDTFTAAELPAYIRRCAAWLERDATRL